MYYICSPKTIFMKDIKEIYNKKLVSNHTNIDNHFPDWLIWGIFITKTINIISMTKGVGLTYDRKSW